MSMSQWSSLSYQGQRRSDAEAPDLGDALVLTFANLRVMRQDRLRRPARVRDHVGGPQGAGYLAQNASAPKIFAFTPRMSATSH